MGAGPITFNYTAWTVLFPELASVSEVQATQYFGVATMYVRNDGGGPIRDVNMLTNALNFTTAHVAKLLSQETNGVPTTGGTSPPPGIVGRINTANQGSVSVGLDFPEQQPNAAWWNQTTYGAMVWSMLKPYRTARYLGSTRRRTYNPPARYFGWGI